MPDLYHLAADIARTGNPAPYAATTGRRPALAGFLARHVLRENHNDPKALVVGSRKHTVATCRAELAWSYADWKRMFPHAIDHAEFGAHPAEAFRMAHEVAAARVVNCNSHLLVVEGRMRALLERIPGQRRAADDWSQTEAYRGSWQITLDGSLSDLVEYRGTLRRALVAYRKNAAEYRRLRSEIDAPDGAPCQQRAA